MKGIEYEKFVKAVLVHKLNLSPDKLKSTREPGVTFPGDEKLFHQIDLFHVDGNEIAEYTTIIECKYRTSEQIDQKIVQNFAFVKGSIKASKAIIVSNQGFTSGAKALAKVEKIALLQIVPDAVLEEPENNSPVNELYENYLNSFKEGSNKYNVVVVQRMLPDPNDKGTDLIESLLSDPHIRSKVEELANDPEIRRRANDFLRGNPDLARKANDFLKGFR